jgi:DNA-binding beta-propeller fold protein YncE
VVNNGYVDISEPGILVAASDCTTNGRTPISRLQSVAYNPDLKLIYAMDNGPDYTMYAFENTGLPHTTNSVKFQDTTYCTDLVGYMEYKDGYLWVADSDIVYKFDGKLTLVDSFLTDAGVLRGLALDDSGYIYLADYSSSMIWKYTTDGQAVTNWGEYGTRLGYFKDLHDLEYHNGKLYVADTGNDRIQIFDTDGNFLSAINAGELAGEQYLQPRGLKVHENKLFITTEVMIGVIPLE